MAGTSNSDERRQYIRMDASGLRLAYEKLDGSVVKKAKEELLKQPSAGGLAIEAEKFFRISDPVEALSEQFKDMMQFMQRLDAKLDYLIAMEEGEKPPKIQTHPISMVDISGAGLSFYCQEELPEKSYLKIHIELSRFPMTEINTIAKVMWSQKIQEGNMAGYSEVGVYFETIHEDDRERIFQYIARMERKMLRDRKEAKTPY